MKPFLAALLILGSIQHERADTSSWPKPQWSDGMSQEEKLTAIRQFLAEMDKRDLFSGVVLIANDGKPILHQAYGLANRELNAPNAPDTKFNLGSINKMFTAIAIRQLASAGKLSLNDTVRKHLPDSPLLSAEVITIQQLLEHRSGLGDIFNENWDRKPKNELRSIGDYLPLFANEPLQFEPGKRQQYSNAGYIVLGAIIEKLSGQTYYDYVRENIFAPAAMKNTESYELDAIVLNRAVGYTQRGLPGKRSNIYTLPSRGSSAGGGYSTAPDLLKFANAAAAGKIKGARNEGVGVAGGSPGVNAALEIAPERGMTIIVLANTDPPAATYASRQIRETFGLEE